MALKIKAKEKKLKFSKDGPEVYRYVMVPDLYSTLDQEKVIKEAAIRSGVSEGVMQACWKGAGEVIKAWATEGHSVALPGLGNMRFGLSAKAVADVNDVKTSLIRTRRIIVKRVTSADPGTVEETDNTDDNGVNNGSEQNGSQQTETVAAPTISGETPFDESTQVTLSGPEGAEIRYTVDGSTPTAESSLYSEALTLTDTVLVKAIAIKDGVSSEVASKTFTKNGSGDNGGGFDTGS